MKKRFLATFLALFLVLGMLPRTAWAAEDTTEDPVFILNGQGDEIELSYPMSPDESFQGEPAAEAAQAVDESDFILNGQGDEIELLYPTGYQPGSGQYSLWRSLPSKYNSVTEKMYQSPVRNQGSYGLCWAFCAYGTLESWMLKKNEARASKYEESDRGNAAGQYNFSELHMGYATSSSGNNPKGDTTRPDPDQAGSRSTAAAYLMRGPDLNGAVAERSDPYPKIETTYNGNSMPIRNVSETRAVKPSHTVSNILYITGKPSQSKSQTDVIKNHILSQGGVGSCMWSDMGTLATDTGNSMYFNKRTSSYYYNGEETDNSNHLVEIVGWDDTYGIENFAAGNRPANPGAWLVRNSWGSDWGDNGYFWVSYEDKDFPGWVFCFDGDVSPYNNDLTVYETDYVANGASWGWETAPQAYFVRIYTTKTANEKLTSVRFMLGGPNTVEVGTIAVNADGTLATGADVFHPLTVTTSTQSGNIRTDGTKAEIDYPGWYTLDITNGPTYTEAGTKFAVVIKLTENQSVAGGNLYFPYDVQNDAPTGTSYLATNTNNWNYEGKNFCIKAVTSPAAPEHIHQWAAAWSIDTTHHWHDCTASGCTVTANSDKDSYGEHVYDDAMDATCNTCGYTRVVTPPTPEHTHQWATAWSNDATHHWHDCTASDCTVTTDSDKDSYGEHDYDDAMDTTCNTCGYTRVVTPPTPEHTHQWAAAWSSDTTHHWHDCTASDCTVTANSDKDGYSTHVYDDAMDTTCNTCGYIRAVTPPRPVDSDETYYISIPQLSNGEITPSTYRANRGEFVTLTVFPDSGYELESITVTNAHGREIALRDLGNGRYSFTMPNTRVSVDAHFTRIADNAPSSNPVNDEPFTGLGTPGISGIVLNPAAMPFADVKTGNWFYNSADYVWKHYLMSGVSDNRFSPDTTTSRAMIWTILARMNNVRTDINPGSTWYEKGMLWAMEQGVTDGTTPMGDITREQLATMLWRNAGKPGGTADLSRFNDSGDVSAYAQTAVRWAVANGIINGSDGSLNPGGTATRAQVAAMVQRYGERIGA